MIMLSSLETDLANSRREEPFMEAVSSSNFSARQLFETSRQFCYLEILRVLFVVSVPVSCLTFYLICFRTTKSMGLYKNYLLSMTFWNASQCILVSYLLQYEMLETSAMIIVIRGPIRYLGEFAAHLCTICVVACTNNLGMSIALCSVFKYLHLSGRVSANSWKPRQLLIISGVVHVIVTLITVTPTALSYTPSKNLRANREYKYFDLLQLLSAETLLIYDPSIKIMVSYYAFIRLLYGFLTYGIIFVCLGMTIWVLKTRKTAFRKKAYRMQEMLIRTLVIHTLIPVFGLLIPFFVVPFLFNAYTAKIQILNVLSVCCGSILNNLSTIYTIKPYRDTITTCCSTKTWHEKVKKNSVSRMFGSIAVTTECESALYIENRSDKSSRSDKTEVQAV